VNDEDVRMIERRDCTRLFMKAPQAIRVSHDVRSRPRPLRRHRSILSAFSENSDS
jgi:hypothetical protein